MNLSDIQNTLSSVKDWEDSYLKNGKQRLLGESKNIRCEIMLGNKIESVIISFDSVEKEILSITNLVSGSIEDSLRFFESAATFVSSSSNTPYQENFQDYSLKIARIDYPDGGASVLYIQLLPE